MIHKLACLTTYKIEEKTRLTMLYKIVNEIANIPNKEILIFANVSNNELLISALILELEVNMNIILLL